MEVLKINRNLTQNAYMLVYIKRKRWPHHLYGRDDLFTYPGIYLFIFKNGFPVKHEDSKTVM